MDLNKILGPVILENFNLPIESFSRLFMSRCLFNSSNPTTHELSCFTKGESEHFFGSYVRNATSIGNTLFCTMLPVEKKKCFTKPPSTNNS